MLYPVKDLPNYRCLDMMMLMRPPPLHGQAEVCTAKALSLSLYIYHLAPRRRAAIRMIEPGQQISGSINLASLHSPIERAIEVAVVMVVD